METDDVLLIRGRRTELDLSRGGRIFSGILKQVVEDKATHLLIRNPRGDVNVQYLTGAGRQRAFYQMTLARLGKDAAEKVLEILDQTFQSEEPISRFTAVYTDKDSFVADLKIERRNLAAREVDYMIEIDR